jgi:hypothetical protein
VRECFREVAVVGDEKVAGSSNLPVVVLADLIPQSLALEDECVLPAQVLPAPPDTGVCKLFRALLETSLRDLASRNKADREDALAWINDTEPSEYIFSFVNVCETLGMNPRKLREACQEFGPAIRDRLTRNRTIKNAGAIEDDY